MGKDSPTCKVFGTQIASLGRLPAEEEPSGTFCSQFHR